MPPTMTEQLAFHGHGDDELTFAATQLATLSVQKYFAIKERELSYRFTLHQHPYVGRLLQKLIRAGVPGLQAADTEYAPGGATVPDSVEVSLDGPAELPLATGTRVVLTGGATATTPAGPVELGAGLSVRLAGVTTARAPYGARGTLLQGIAGLPAVGTVFSVGTASGMVLTEDTPGRLTSAVPVVLHTGNQATVPADTEVVVPAEGGTTVAAGAKARLLKRQWLPKELFEELFTSTQYNPSPLVRRPYPVKDLDFSARGAYAPYNWELFFHVPLTIAMHLSRNHRFADAQRWFHYLFDPTDDTDGPTPERFWKVRPFQATDVTKVEEILVNLATGADATLAQETLDSITTWGDAPFRPHAVARRRHQAYMYKTVMAYLDNLLAWGDSLFRQDTGEAVDEALILYVLAAEILGPRPLPVPTKGTIRPQTYDNLRADLRKFGTVLRDIEADGPFDIGPFPAEGRRDGTSLATGRSLGKALYFQVPPNDQLLGYWDTVADRLFKIRNSLNIAGTFRRLALFDPPIDPALLARAAASGLDVASIVSGLNQPLPLVRFQLLAQKAAELAQEVKGLGAALLSAMEKEDGEALAVLRARHERMMLELAEHVKYGQLQEATKSKEGLVQSLALAVQRYTYYERQLGKQEAEIAGAIPELAELNPADLEKMRLITDEPTVAPRSLEVDIAQDLGVSGGHIMSSHEAEEMAKLAAARGNLNTANVFDKIAGVLAIIPQIGAHGQPFGPGVSVSFGGSNLGAAMNFIASLYRSTAEGDTYDAGTSARIGSYARREQEWAHQSNLAAGEISQVIKQLRAAQIREAVASLELANHRRQIEQASTIERFLNEDGTDRTGKLTNRALYAWMKRELRGLHGQCFQLAFDVARKAERALQRELGDSRVTYVQFGYLAGKEGLLAGEKLHLDVQRMQLAYQELNQREYELTKHVSLLQCDPLALLQLRTTGRCTIRLPETLFDLDGPGHYFRRINSMAVSVPCVTGPYAGVNLTLTLLKSSTRKSPAAGDQYARTGTEDPRFEDYFGSAQSVVTSSGQNDSGLFEAGLRDDRYLPFEHSGVISEWQLELPANPSKGDPAQFDYNTISDVLLHLRYTARPGGDLLRRMALDEINTRIHDATMAGCVRLFSTRYEFPNEWAAFQRATPVNDRRPLQLDLRPQHYPFWAQQRLGKVTRVDLLAHRSDPTAPDSLDVYPAADAGATPDTLTNDPTRGNLLIGQLSAVPLPERPTGIVSLYIENIDLDDLWIAITWGG